MRSQKPKKRNTDKWTFLRSQLIVQGKIALDSLGRQWALIGYGIAVVMDWSLG